MAPFSLPDGWEKMSHDEKYRYYAAGWTTSKGKRFETPEIARLYEKRARRILDVVALKEPDEVPVYFWAEGLILAHGGIQPKDAFYDMDKFISAVFKLHDDFNLNYSLLTFPQSGRVLDTLGMKLIHWPGSAVPGSGLPDDTSFQYVEDEYMRADEYDELINNPEGYIIRRYFPRIFSYLEGLSTLPNAFNMVQTTGFAGPMLGLVAGSPARRSIELLLKAVDQAGAVMMKFMAANRKILGRYGSPLLFGGVTFPPYDLIGDTMRCTVGIVKDMYSRPEKVLAAVEALVPMAVQMGVQTAEATGCPFIIMPLHKGSDSFMSSEQFKTFYWPTLKATMQGLIVHGCVPVPFVEGTYDRRLDIIAADPLPGGRSMWIFDRTDMKAAKEKLGRWACIAGNVPASLFKQGTPEMLEAYCRDLIEACAPGGGFCLFPGSLIDQANPENIRAYINCGRKFGKY